MRNQKTVVHVIQSLGRGGCEKMLLDILPLLEKKGWHNIVITLQPGGDLEPSFQNAGIPITTVRLKHLFDIPGLFQLRSTVRTFRPALISTYLLRADIIGRFFLSLFVSCPIVPYLVTTYNHPRYRIARIFEWASRPFVRTYFANSRVIEDYYETRLDVRRGKVQTIESGVDTAVFRDAQGEELRRELCIPHTATVITCVANLAPNKGQQFLLAAFDEAFHKRQDVFLLLVGEGDEKERLLSQREALASKAQILFLGRRGDVPHILAASDIFVLPTLFEGMSIAILEAMASGKAIITTNIPENKPLIPDNRFGRLVPPQSISELATELDRLERDTILRLALGKAAQERSQEHFSLEAQVTKLSTAYHALIATSTTEHTSAKTSESTHPRIVHLIQSLGNGGCENALLRILPQLAHYEHHIVTLKEKGVLAKEFSRSGITVHTVNMKHLLDWNAYSRLLQIIKNIQPRIILTYLLHADMIGRLFLQRRLSIPIIPFLRTTYNHARYRFARILEWMTRSMVWHYLANSAAVKNFYVKKIGIQPENITIIENGLDANLYKQADAMKITTELQLPPNRFVITSVANFFPNKGHASLLSAFEKVFRTYQNVILLLVGDGPEKLHLKMHIQNYQSKDQIFFLGVRRDVPDILKGSDCFVLPTAFEGMSNALLEAMATGLPVITTDIPENRELIEDKHNGILVPIQNSKALEEALLFLYDQQEERKRLGNNAQTFIQQSFSLEETKRKWSEFLRKYCT